MAVLKLNLPDPLHHWIEMQTSLGGYTDAEDFVSQVLQGERRRQELESLEAKLVESIQGEPSIPLTAEHWKSLKQVARKGKQREESIKLLSGQLHWMNWKDISNTCTNILHRE